MIHKAKIIIQLMLGLRQIITQIQKIGINKKRPKKTILTVQFAIFPTNGKTSTKINNKALESLKRSTIGTWNVKVSIDAFHH